MRALVLGGAGFIGLHLVRRLVRDGLSVTVVDDFSRGREDAALAEVCAHPAVDVVTADLTRSAAWDALPGDCDHVYVLAAVVGVRNVEADPARVIRINTLVTLHLMDWMRVPSRVFFASTSEVYAGAVDAGFATVPTAEDVPALVADVGAPRFAYAASKLLGEAAVLHGARARGAEVVVGRFHNVYGPRMGTDHVIPEMALRAMRGENPFRVPGADQSRAFCHIDDAVEAMVGLMAAPAAAGEIVHIGNDTEETSIASLASLVLRVAGLEAPLQAAPAPRGSVHRRCPDVGKLRQLTGFQPRVGLEDGVRDTFAWYRTHHGQS